MVLVDNGVADRPFCVRRDVAFTRGCSYRQWDAVRASVGTRMDADRGLGRAGACAGLQVRAMRQVQRRLVPEQWRLTHEAPSAAGVRLTRGHHGELCAERDPTRASLGRDCTGGTVSAVLDCT